MKPSDKEADTGKVADESPKKESPKSENTIGIDVPEEFQQKAHEITHKATKAMLSHLSNKINERHDAIREEEKPEKVKTGNMSMDGAPASVGEYD